MSDQRTTVNIGIIGGGLMGREVAGAFQRWSSLVDHPVRPSLVAVADVAPAALDWFDAIPSVRTRTADYRELLADDSIDIVYVALRHDLHAEVYTDVIRAGKDLLAEKPFGIDLAAAEQILDAVDTVDDVFVRCSSELPFYPGAQWALRAITSGSLGAPFRVRARFLHSSDLDQSKPISWKRQARYNGASGVLNDLGLHALHVPLRLGWHPASVYAELQDLVPQRPGPESALVPADTFDNAELHTWVEHRAGRFPMTIEVARIAPGEKNTWSLEFLGLDGGVRFSTKNPKDVQLFDWKDVPGVGREQAWTAVEAGSQSVWPTVAGAHFEFGFSDSILQMWAAFLAERAGVLGDRFGCATPREAVETHRIYAAAMRSHAAGSVAAVGG